MVHALCRAILALAFPLIAAQPAHDATSPSQVTPDHLRTVRAAEAERVALIARLEPAVVCIFPPRNQSGGGSGVIISPDGYGLTNYHVVAGLGAPRQGKGGRSDGKLYPLEVLGFDPAGDVAMFKLTADEPLPFVPLGDSSHVNVGDATLALGNPFLLAEDYRPTVTFGVVSGLHRYLAGQERSLIYSECIEVNTSINPGNSGGPLFNMRGELIGINGRIGIEERGRVNVGVGYAISINQIKRFIPALKAGLVTPHATLGATVTDEEPRRVVVDRILESSDAYRAGLRDGDEIYIFDDVPIRSANQLMSLIQSYPSNWPVCAGLTSNGAPRSIRFRLDNLPLPKQPRMPRNVPEEVKKTMIAPLTGINWDANARQTAAAIEQWMTFLGGRSAANAVKGWRVRFTRTALTKLVGPENADPTVHELVEPIPDGPRPSDANGLSSNDLFESDLRLLLLKAPPAPHRNEWQVLRGDQVGKQLAVVLLHREQPRRDIEYSFDVETGRLLRIAFTEPAGSGASVEYDYDDWRAVGNFMLPHKRICRRDNADLFEDRVERYDLRTRDE